ncbi:YncE family protein [Dongia sedimenti]|uniref:DUF1513 domain-containing protein n=1 Tax=Dongia sedimenti TaxID=3064282 RepID=A0ABU0YKZ1_9PROT|nr:DUF1513 domain-containing protein [Rhodospirillaceae bacterium R-7]
MAVAAGVVVVAGVAAAEVAAARADGVMAGSLTRRQALEAALVAFTAAAVVPGIRHAAQAGTEPSKWARLYVPGYRSELATSGDRLLVDIPEITRVPADWTANRTILNVLDLADPTAEPRRAAYPVRGHGLQVLPALNVGVFSGMESDTVVGFDLDTLDMTAFVRPAQAGWRFGGHPAIMPDGKHVAIAERHPAEPKSGDRAADIARLSGRIVIRDAVTLAPVGAMPSYGIRPHEIQVTDDGRHLVVAHYGSTNVAGSGDDNPDIPDPIAPGIAVIEIASGKLVSWIDGTDPMAELRHLAGKRLDRIFAVTAKMAWAGSPEAAGLEADPGAEHGFEYLASQPVRAVGGHAQQLLSEHVPLTRHGLSVLYDGKSDEILMTFPATHRIALFDGATGTLKKLIRTDALGLRWPCGVALSPDGAAWHVTGYWSGMMTLKTGTHLVGSVAPVPKWWGHSHTVIG